MSHQDPSPSSRRPYHHWTDHTELCQRGPPDALEALPAIATFTQEPPKKAHILYTWVDRLEDLGSWCHGLNSWLCERLYRYSAFSGRFKEQNKQSWRVTVPPPYSPCSLQTFRISKGINIFTFPRYRGAASTLWEVAGDRFTLTRLSCTCEIQIYEKSIQVFISTRSSWLFLTNVCCRVHVLYMFSLTGLVLEVNWAELLLHIAINGCKIPESIGSLLIFLLSMNA